MSEPALGPRFLDALAYAARVHEGQTRSATAAPYLAHLLAVAANVLEDAGRAGEVAGDEAVAALLHDTAEDHGGTERLVDVRTRFGDEVAELVEALSDSLDPDPPPWRDRKADYVRKLEREGRRSVLRLSLADKLDNVRAILGAYRVEGDVLWGRFHSREDTLWYYGAVAEVLSRRAPGPMAEELARTVAELRQASPAA